MKQTLVVQMLFIACMAVLLGCTKQSNVRLAASSKEAQSELTLLFAQTKEVVVSGNSAFHVKFSKLIEDSRCPTGVTCVWKGTAKIELTFAPSDQKVIELEKSINHTTNGKTYRITFLKLTPYPSNSGALDIHVLEAHLLVEEL